MTEIFIAGIGQTPVGEHWERSLRSLAVEAIQLALEDAGGLKPGALFAANTLAANLSRQAHLGAMLADYAGLAGIEAGLYESGGASGGAAIRQAMLAIESGMVETAIVVGVEKVTDSIGNGIETAMMTTTDSEYESPHGLTATAQAALLTGRYLYENKLPPDALAGFPLTGHAHGAGNPKAMYRKALAGETYQRAEAVCDPLNLYDIAPLADGAAAVVLTCAGRLPQGTSRARVRLAASAAASDTMALHNRKDMLDFAAARLSASTALQRAGVRPEEIDLFEYHDAFSIYAAISLEAAGFAARGKGWNLAAEGAISLTGQIPCATMGGLKARGYPVGASGVYQAVEATLQLRGEAGKNQIASARTALIQALGGPAASAVTHVLQRVD